MFELIKPSTKIDFVGKRHLYTSVSVLLIVLTFVLFFTKGLNYGIDFTGGAEVQLKAPPAWDIGKLRDELQAGGFTHFKVQQIGTPDEHQFLVKAQGTEGDLNQVSAQIGSIIGKTAQPGEYEIQRDDVVGPAAGESLRMSGFLSMLYALICILLYVTIRFDARYAPGAVLALFHDTVITIGIFILTQKQFDLQILAALLALIGYSNNDTIIIFDRVREVQHNHPNLNIHDAVNRAVNETLGRTILTSLMTFFTVFALWALGGKVIEDFAFTLLVGIIVGSYSSIFIASAFVVYFTELRDKRSSSAKKKGGGKKKSYSVRPEPKFQ